MNSRVFVTGASRKSAYTEFDGILNGDPMKVVVSTDLNFNLRFRQSAT
jgi:hypothetical protein